MAGDVIAVLNGNVVGLRCHFGVKVFFFSLDSSYSWVYFFEGVGVGWGMLFFLLDMTCK